MEISFVFHLVHLTDTGADQSLVRSWYKTEQKKISLLFSNFSNRNRCVKVNNTYSTYTEIISGTFQRSILGFFFNVFSNDLFFFIETVFMHNFAGDKPYLCGLNQFLTWVSNLKIAFKNVIDQFKFNKIIVNPEKFAAIF